MARAARTDDAVSRRIQAWSADVLGDDVSAALEEFVGDDRFMDDEDIAVFTTWFHNDRQLSGGGTPAERYAARTGLPEDERETATRIAAARLGFYRVLAVEAGRTLTLEPILGGARFEVTSPHVSRQVALWDRDLTRVMPGDPLGLFGPTRLFEPCEEVELLAELARLAGTAVARLDEQAATRAYAGSALELMRFIPPSRNVEPSFFTFEGDPVAFASAAWRVRDVAAVDKILRRLGGLDPDEPAELDVTAVRADLVRGRPALPPGALVLESSQADDLDTISIAGLRLEHGTLQAEAISVERLEDTIGMVQHDFGELVELIAYDVQSVEEARADRNRKRGDTQSSRPAASEQELGAALMGERMLRWLDEPHQLLGGQTPREAVNGHGRDTVVRLLRQIENSADRARRNGEPAPDVSPLQDHLGLRDDLAA